MKARSQIFQNGLGLIGRGGLELAYELKNGGFMFLVKIVRYLKYPKNAVSGLCDAKFDFLTVQGDPQVIKAAVEGRKALLKYLRLHFLQV